jgi:hypothetical protein
MPVRLAPADPLREGRDRVSPTAAQRPADCAGPRRRAANRPTGRRRPAGRPTDAGVAGGLPPIVARAAPFQR